MPKSEHLGDLTYDLRVEPGANGTTYNILIPKLNPIKKTWR